MITSKTPVSLLRASSVSPGTSDSISFSSSTTSSPSSSTPSSSPLLSKSLLTSPSSPYPGPPYQLQQGDLKKAFLGKLSSSTLDVQLVTCPELRSGLVRKVLALSDSRDSTTSWAVRDSLLVGLVKRGLQPVIRVTDYMVDLHNDKPTLNIVTYEVIDNTKEVVGKPQPIQLPFFNYLRNLAKTPSPLVSPMVSQAPARCRACRGCLATNACRKIAKVGACSW